MAAKRIQNLFQVDHRTQIKKEEANWITSYADMITILLCFFMLFFNVSRLDPTVIGAIKKDLKKSFSLKLDKLEQHAVPSKERFKSIESYISKDSKFSSELQMRMDLDEMVITFANDKYFESGSTILLPGMRKIVNKVARIIKRQGGSFQILVEGHSDSAPLLGSLRLRYKSNWVLSGIRAARIVNIFLAKRIKKERLSAIGYADSRPLVKEKKYEWKLAQTKSFNQ